MTIGPDEFDMSAAWLRRAQSDMAAFMSAFAARVDGALPGRVTVERRHDGLFSKTSHVARITLRGERAIYDIAMHKGEVTASRAKLVRGVTISSTALSVPDWLTEVRAEIMTLAEHQGAAADVLHDFL